MQRSSHLLKPPSSPTLDTHAPPYHETSLIPHSMTSAYDSVHLILPTNNADHVLAETLAPDLVRLPTIKVPPDYHKFGDCHEDALERFIHSQLSITVHLARRLLTDYDIHTPSTNSESLFNDLLYLAYILDDHLTCKSPLTWVHRDQLTSTRWVSVTGEIDDDEFLEQLEDIFKEVSGAKASPRNRAWVKIGWYQDLTAWVHGVLKTLNMSMQGNLRKHYITVESVVMKCSVTVENSMGQPGQATTSEVVFVKNTLPSSREVRRTVAVASVVGRFAPDILGFDEEKGRIILRDCGKLTDEPVDQGRLIDSVLKMQKLSMTFISQLEARGLEVRDSEWVEANMETILNHELLDVYYGGKGPLPFRQECKEVVTKVRQKIEILKDRCRRLTELGLPRTLVHGDLYDPNVGSRQKRGGGFYPFIDWAASFIGNPLHDFGSLLYYRYNEDSERGKQAAIEFKNGFSRICRQWQSCSALTIDEMRSMFDITSDMIIIIAIHELTEHYDACENKDESEVNSCVDELRQWIGDLINKPSI